MRNPEMGCLGELLDGLRSLIARELNAGSPRC